MSVRAEAHTDHLSYLAMLSATSFYACCLCSGRQKPMMTSASDATAERL